MFWVSCCSSCTKLFSVLENKLYGDADDSTLVTKVQSSLGRVAASECLNRYLNDTVIDETFGE